MTVVLFRWNNLRDLAKQKRDALNLAHSTSTWYIECNETMVRIYGLWFYHDTM